jgi:hypothetical protein
VPVLRASRFRTIEDPLPACARRVSFVALLVLASACGSPTPVEPSTKAAVPTPRPTPIPVKTWTGTFSGVSLQCTSPATVVYEAGEPPPTEATVPCLGGRIFLDLTRQGNTVTGYALWGDPEFYPVTGTLTDSAMDMTIFNDTVDFPNGPTGPLGTIHLHP